MIYTYTKGTRNQHTASEIMTIRKIFFRNSSLQYSHKLSGPLLSTRRYCKRLTREAIKLLAIKFHHHRSPNLWAVRFLSSEHKSRSRKGGAKHHRKVLLREQNFPGSKTFLGAKLSCDAWHRPFLTKPAIRRLARRGGVKRVSGLKRRRDRCSRCSWRT
jgi:hypothetical protein